MKKLIIIAIILAGSGLNTHAQSTNSMEPEAKAALKLGLINICENNMGGGVVKQMASFCDCFANNAIANMSIEEITQCFPSEGEPNQQAMDKMTKIIQSCLKADLEATVPKTKEEMKEYFTNSCLANMPQALGGMNEGVKEVCNCISETTIQEMTMVELTDIYTQSASPALNDKVGKIQSSCMQKYIDKN